jgi:hypothetical protein
MNQNPSPTGRQSLVQPGAPTAVGAVTAPQPQDADATEVPSFLLRRDFLAPGVRLLRGAGFTAKAAAVSLAFLVPLVLLACSFWSVSMESIAFSSR